MEQALLVHVRLRHPDHRDRWPVEESSEELRGLAHASGVEVLEEMAAARERPTASHLVGRGRAEEIHDRCHALRPGVVIFSRDLSSPQQRNLEELLGVKVIDRSQLILDIFAQRARSREGQVQVELAQLQYLLPRLAGKGILLSRLGGGIGTRGPGEQKLEVDRRRIRLRISRLSRELGEIRARRAVARQKRERERVPTVALVGYTNAGKSALLNALTHADAVAKDQLFTTLDPLTRRLDLPGQQPLLLTDTVGFLHELPHHLIDAFRATLEEVSESRFLLHVLDGSDRMVEEKVASVRAVLEELGAESKPVLTALNKVDRLDEAGRRGLQKKFPEGVLTSAVSGEGLPALLARLEGTAGELMQPAEIWIRPGQLQWIEPIYKQGQVLARRDTAKGVKLTVRLPGRLAGQLKKAGILPAGE